jgi:hypothetical protein
VFVARALVPAAPALMPAFRGMSPLRFRIGAQGPAKVLFCSFKAVLNFFELVHFSRVYMPQGIGNGLQLEAAVCQPLFLQSC